MMAIGSVRSSADANPAEARLRDAAPAVSVEKASDQPRERMRTGSHQLFSDMCA